MSAVFLVAPSESSAGPAPRLTDVQIVGITSDGNNGVWENIEHGQLKAKTPLKGENMYLKVRFMGYDKDFLAFSGETPIKRSAKIYDIDVIAGSNRIVVGRYYYIKIPISALPEDKIRIDGIDTVTWKIIEGNTLNFDRGEN